ncbi:MAG: oligosaccharide flippase family protein, partial [Merismopedia sp. SIO2A8]|nr:oligosaccharide flippase family protein [Merismopedia sp. SIO2A8]
WLSCWWRPGLPRLHSGASSMVAFGASIMGFRIINYFARNTDNILIGRFQGAQALGVYSIAYRLLLMPIQQINIPITNVAIPVLSRLQDNPKKFTNYYYKALLLIASISMPIIGFLFADVDNLVRLFLGIKWIESINIFKLLAPAAFVGTIKVCLGWAFISLGHVNRQLWQGLVSSLVTVAGFFVGVHWGVSGVATAYSITEPIVVLASLTYCYQQTPMSLGGFFKHTRFPAISAIGASSGIMGINYFFNFSINLGLNIFLDLLIYSILYFTIWVIIPGGKESLHVVVATSKSIRRRKS